MLHSDCELMRMFEGGEVGYGLRIEDDDVGEISLFQKSATIKLQIGRGQTGQTADRVFERNDLLFADVFAEQSGEVAVGARVRRGFQKYAFGGHRTGVGAE